MKLHWAIVPNFLVFTPVEVQALRLGEDAPIDKVVKLLEEMKSEVETDGASEQSSYNKFACWCEEMVATKAQDINDAKDGIESKQAEVIRFSGDLGGHRAQIPQLEKDIKNNLESQKEATEIRDKENENYQEEREQSEQCVGALEAAIKVLTGAGSGRGFLETYREAQVLSIVSGVRNALLKPPARRALSAQDLQTVEQFVGHPDDFMNHGNSMISAAQISNNPFGDYAPQSSQIQGILKSLYDSFASDLEKSNADEADKQKEFETLMETKKEELKTLETSLQQELTAEATKTKTVADNKEWIDKAKDQLEADETMFSETKKTCSMKAREWNERARLRSTELAGIDKAIEILTDPEAAEKLKAAHTSFLQVSTTERRDKTKVYLYLKMLAKKLKNLSIAQLAMYAKTGGHFDKVIEQIDEMIVDLRKEEKEDIEQRDRCESKTNENDNAIEDLNQDIDKAKKKLSELGIEKSDLDNTISDLESAINATKSDIDTLKQLRKEEYETFRNKTRDDEAAIPIIEDAIGALQEFYSDNKIPLEFSQTASRPNTNFQGDYKGASGSSGGVIGMMKMIKEDLEKEIKVAGKEDAEAEEAYIKDRIAMQKTIEKQEDSKNLAESDLADVMSKIAELEESKSEMESDLDAENEKKKALIEECGWVKTHFEKRREKRTAEIEALIDAKNFLAGVDSGDALAY